MLLTPGSELPTGPTSPGMPGTPGSPSKPGGPETPFTKKYLMSQLNYIYYIKTLHSFKVILMSQNLQYIQWNKKEIKPLFVHNFNVFLGWNNHIKEYQLLVDATYSSSFASWISWSAICSWGTLFDVTHNIMDFTLIDISKNGDSGEKIKIRSICVCEHYFFTIGPERPGIPTIYKNE